MKKQILFISMILFGVSIASAQTEPLPIKQISAGVVNGKATTLAKPVYPAAARAVNAEGAVNVQVVIDEEGNVVSAEAVSGHPLLRGAAREAALQSKFKPTVLSGQAVKVTGVIVYNFVADRANWFKVGYELASVQYSPTLRFLNTNSIEKNFQADWTAEKEQLERLAAIKQAENSNISQPVVTGERKISENTEKKPDGTIVKTVITEQAVKADNQTTGEQIAISQSLISSLQGRLGADESNLWQFNLGLNLSRALANVRNANEKQKALEAIRLQIQAPPAKISAEYAADIQRIVTILEKPNPTAEDRQQIGQIMPRLFRN